MYHQSGKRNMYASLKYIDT